MKFQKSVQNVKVKKEVKESTLEKLELRHKVK